ncbi:hypothetical protein JCM11641_001613 [Rhodosporidiobolus odoratus]
MPQRSPSVPAPAPTGPPTSLASSTTPPPDSIPKPAPASPVCYIHYGPRSVKARIDREVPLEEIIKQLAASAQLAVAEPAALFALREKETGALVTEENLERMLAKGNVFDLCSSPTIEAVEMVDKLSSSEPAVLKLATFSLRTLIKDRAFLDEFIARGGLDALQEAIRKSSGNTLAYSLLSLQNLLELEASAWTSLEKSFIARIVEIIATEPLINISRPATAILRRIASQPAPSATPLPSLQSPNPDRESPYPSTTADSSGFATVYSQVLLQPKFLGIVIERLGSGDVPVTEVSLGLLETLLRGANEIGDLRLSDELDRLNAWKVVGKPLTTPAVTSLPTLLTLQDALSASLHQQLLTPLSTSNYTYFDSIWIASGLEDTDETLRWRRLGFRTESPQMEYEETGVLGLKMLARYAGEEENEFATTISDQLTRPSNRRCPIATVSSTALILLATHFDVLSPPPATPATTPKPYLFRLPELHSLVVQFFLRMWSDSGASTAMHAGQGGDFERLTRLAASQVAFVLASPPSGGAGGAGGEGKSWSKVRQDFLSADYRTVRERQVREMEIEDDILSKAPVRNLRGRLYLESYEFVRAQRIACLHEGSWFQVVPTPNNGKKNSQQSGGARRWRFYRLAANRKALHWVESGEKVQVTPGIDDLPERVDVSAITDVVSSTASGLQRPPRPSSSGNRPSSGHRPSSSISRPLQSQNRISILSRASSDTVTHPSGSSASTPTSLTFTLHLSSSSPMTLLAPSPTVYSEWVDGLALLRPEGSISTRQTADYVQALTDIGVKIKLLDLSGERVEIPAGVEVNAVPRSTEFWYADSL